MKPLRTLVLLLLASCAVAKDDAVKRGDAARDSLARERADSIARARQDSINRAQPGYIIDSILPVEEEMRRFRAAVGGAAAATLVGGAPSREELVARFATAVASRDSVALRRLALTAREFIDLVYPSSPYTTAPYRQAPGLVWTQIQLPSGSGYRRLLERLGGRPLHIDATRCPASPERQGANRLYRNCSVRFSADGAPSRDGRLFGTIIERGGQFKFVSFANMY